ncbi:hypothetical protein SAMN05444172_0951 [Burkholderia sp. GAS332]|uniref:hypothetical protein n=1 Tax=Paraburkholderia sediminicola TaxID=458836 RepID=UPI000925F13C|nr:hypothetical protein SAMN05444172_0951 [Burkholderia sp. GAS332]
MNHSVEISNHSLQELTDHEIYFVSGGMEQEGEPNQDAGALSGIVYAIATGAVYGGLGSALSAAYLGNNIGAAGIGGMIGGAVVGGLKHVNGGK